MRVGPEYEIFTTLRYATNLREFLRHSSATAVALYNPALRRGHLALELLQKIASELTFPSDILALSRLSKVCLYYNVVFNEYLYRAPHDTALLTLAQKDQDRLPLQTPHPASFVKVVTLSSKFTSMAIRDALQNIAVKGTNLLGLNVSSPDIPLVRFLDAPLPDFLCSIRQLSLLAPYPRLPQGQSLDLASSLCVSSLTECRLSFNTPSIAANYCMIAALLQSLVTASLECLEVHIPEATYVHDKAQVLAELFDAPSFLFERLRVLTLELHCVFSLNKFFMRHPNLEELRYSGSSPLYDVMEISSHGLLPRLRRFIGSLEDVTALSLHPGLLMEDITVTDIGVPWARNELHCVLSDIPVKYLTVQDISDSPMGYTAESIMGVMESCPSLSYLDFILSVDAVSAIGSNFQFQVAFFLFFLVNGLRDLRKTVMRIPSENIGPLCSVIEGAMESAIPFFTHTELRQIKFELWAIDNEELNNPVAGMWVEVAELLNGVTCGTSTHHARPGLFALMRDSNSPRSAFAEVAQVLLSVIPWRPHSQGVRTSSEDDRCAS
ncbi:hypothetical protein GYMLUDRAFT_247956 [Collybiopsis luxurians FD-317 M1]|uniref:Uncharacterized protein n=1 Tax=Collybiopsis luxurians FD-317 M1 TaxID=944289 RepID=A0A0D0C2E1_9AGAR|nr:hypothetical protein GYMLUDRAFT_247956 [Collybiopsis luxurians FD-317 M1]